MNEECPVISIIMGVLNCERTLDESLGSIAAQTETRWECILCDDGSTDGTADVIRRWQARFPQKFILIQNDRNRGIAASLNRCLDAARGKYIARMDGDDRCSTERFEKELSDLTISSLLLQLLVCIGKNCNREAPAVSRNSHTRFRDYMELFSEALSYIDDHFSEGLTLDEMASRTGFSKFHFSRLFKKYTNYSFIDYLHFRRIREAEILLLRPDISITDVAISSGFSSISSFNRIFRQEKGCSPSEYRYRLLSEKPQV